MPEYLKSFDKVIATKNGRFNLAFRLRLLGDVEGENDSWLATQDGASLPVKLTIKNGDTVDIQNWKETTGGIGNYGRYYWYPYNDPHAGPQTIDWLREVKLKEGDEVLFKVTLGPATLQ